MISRLLSILVLGLTLARISTALEFSGALVSLNGAPPIEELVVQVEHNDNRNAKQPDTFAIRCQPDKEGRFTIEVPNYEKEYMLFVMDDCNRIYKGFAHLHETTNFGVIAVQGGGTLIVTAQNGDRQPLADIEIVLELRLLPYTSYQYVQVTKGRTDANGEFTFTDLSPGEYRWYKGVLTFDMFIGVMGTISITEDPAFLNLIFGQTTGHGRQKTGRKKSER